MPANAVLLLALVLFVSAISFLSDNKKKKYCFSIGLFLLGIGLTVLGKMNYSVKFPWVFPEKTLSYL